MVEFCCLVGRGVSVSEYRFEDCLEEEDRGVFVFEVYCFGLVACCVFWRKWGDVSLEVLI